MAQRAGDAGEDAGRPDIGVLVERLADRQAQPPKRDVIGDAWRADRAKEDRVEPAQPVGAVRRHHHPVLAVVVRAPVEALDSEREPAVAFGAGGEHLEPGLDHLRADAVPAQRRDFVCAHAYPVDRHPRA